MFTPHMHAHTLRYNDDTDDESEACGELCVQRFAVQSSLCELADANPEAYFLSEYQHIISHHPTRCMHTCCLNCYTMMKRTGHQVSQ
eukprot:m.163335 g.163335  ORF g.163335 m.163335 type:complete len:87 (-) comp14381_c0_seq2:192-452(-)